MDERARSAVQRKRELRFVLFLSLGGCVVGYLAGGFNFTGLAVGGVLLFVGSLASVGFSRFLIRRGHHRLRRHS
jgi:predicted membrane channel-forming protein YqfA (hemolysin III family)